eukprot:1475330-Amphidinium_carterae.2
MASNCAQDKGGEAWMASSCGRLSPAGAWAWRCLLSCHSRKTCFRCFLESSARAAQCCCVQACRAANWVRLSGPSIASWLRT